MGRPLPKKVRNHLLLIICLFLPTPIFAGVALEISIMPTSKFAENNFGIGLGFYIIELHSFGFYGNFQITNNEDQDHFDSLTINTFGDPLIDRRQEVFILNLGTTFQATEEVAFYGGIGHSSFTGVAVLNDPTRILASDGSYSVPDPENDDTAINFNVGILLFAQDSNFVFDIGVNTDPSTFFFGIGWKSL